MERVRPLGFFDEAASVDPWNDVTPQELSNAQQEADDASHQAAEDLFLGDGPFAAPVDEKPMRIADPRSPSAISRFALATNALTVQHQPTRDAKGRSTSSIRLGDASVTISRRVPSTAGRATEIVRAHHYERTPPTPSQSPPPHGRRYEKMRALLKNPDRVPHGSASKPKPPPVPGTFIPAGKREKEPPPAPSSPADLDEMLATMAEGLLIGSDASGQTEVRVTLRDEFFAGTELRITLGEGGVSATLVPPDRMTYLTLNGNIDELRMRLESRGLRVSKIRVSEP